MPIADEIKIVDGANKEQRFNGKTLAPGASLVLEIPLACGHASVDLIWTEVGRDEKYIVQE